jgi:heme a synthase
MSTVRSPAGFKTVHGREDPRISRGRPARFHALAIVTVAATLVLIFVGALVTSTGSAMTIPDWPLAFGRLIPRLAGGARFEYTHRVIAALVIVLVIACNVAAWRGGLKPATRQVALAALGLVLFQAVLGGVTVLLDLPLTIAVAHAATAQAFLCVTVALAVLTNPESEPLPVTGGGEYLPAAVTACTVYVQILIGAVMRHMGAGLAIPDWPLSYGGLVPPFFTAGIAVNFAHRCGAIVIAVLVAWTATEVLRVKPGRLALRKYAWTLVFLTAAQLALGAFTVWSERSPLITSAHVIVGAAVLACSFALTLRSWLLRADEAMHGEMFGSTRAGDRAAEGAS